MKQWGKPRPLHKYSQRFWSVPKQDWEYIYNEPKVGSGGGSNAPADPGEDQNRAAAQDELQYRREHQMAQEMSAPSGLAPSKSSDGEGAEDNSEKKVYLEGFEEGYELGKKVGAEE